MDKLIILRVILWMFMMLALISQILFLNDMQLTRRNLAKKIADEIAMIIIIAALGVAIWCAY